jgi:hypothetical protein
MVFLSGHDLAPGGVGPEHPEPERPEIRNFSDRPSYFKVMSSLVKFRVERRSFDGVSKDSGPEARPSPPNPNVPKSEIFPTDPHILRL